MSGLHENREIKNRCIACLGFILSLLFLLQVFSNVDIGSKIIKVSLGLLWFRIGVGLFRKEEIWRKVGVVFFAIASITTSSAVYFTIIAPLFSPNLSGVGIGRWVILLILALLIYSFFSLLGKDLKEIYSEKNT